MSGLESLHCFSDSHNMEESIANEIMNSSPFDIANSMINSDITDAIGLGQTRDVLVDENNSDVDSSYHTTDNIEYSVDNRLVVSVEDEESFNELVQQVANGSNVLNDVSASVGVTTRMRRRKATQPQRLVYCDLDFNVNEDQNFNNDINLENNINTQLLSDDNSPDQNQYTIEMSGEDQESVNHIVLSTLEAQETEPPNTGTKQRNKGFQCEICGSVWNSKTRLKCHYRTHGAEKHLKCNICGKLFGWEYSWKTHMLAHSDDNPNRCPHCGLKLFNKTALSNHIKRIHDNPERPFKCGVCSKCFISKSELNQHSHIHNEEKNFMCEQCGKTFRSKSYLERHYRTHSGVKPFKCEFCGKLLADKTGFTAHIRSHSNIRPFICDICGKRYTIKRHLTSHMIIHSDLRPFKCEQCPKTFRSRTNFRMHKDSHLGIKRWSCKFCNRTFLSQGNMAKHVRRHIGERKHKCFCGKAFIEKQELKNHSKMHSTNESLTQKSNQDIQSIQLEEVPQLSSEVSTLSNNSNNSEPKCDSNLNQFRDSLVNRTVPNETETEDNVEVTSSGQTSLLSMSSPLTTITLPTLSPNLCLPLSSVHPLTTINVSQTYQSIENINNIDNNTTLSFYDFQRSETNRPFYGNNNNTNNNNNTSRSTPNQSNSTFFTSHSPIESVSTQNQYINETQNSFLHCSLCSGVFITINNLREHLIDFHRVEAEKVISMMY